MNELLVIALWCIMYAVCAAITATATMVSLKEDPDEEKVLIIAGFGLFWPIVWCALLILAACWLIYRAAKLVSKPFM